MGGLKLFGMKAACDENVATAVKRQHEPQKVVGDLITAGSSEKQTRSIKYQITIAKLPLAKDVAEFVFDATPNRRAATFRDMPPSTARITRIGEIFEPCMLASLQHAV